MESVIHPGPTGLIQPWQASVFMVFLFWAMNSTDIVHSQLSHDYVADSV